MCLSSAAMMTVAAAAVVVAAAAVDSTHITEIECFLFGFYRELFGRRKMFINGVA